jgi:hypothetical protein
MPRLIIPTTRPTQFNDCEVPSEELRQLVDAHLHPVVKALVTASRLRGFRLREVLWHASDELHCCFSQEILADALGYRAVKPVTRSKLAKKVP